MKERVLIVEDNPTIARLLSNKIGSRYGLACDVIETLKDCKAILSTPHNYILALVDIVLDDCSQGEAIDETINHGIPTIAMTAVSDESLKSEILAKNLVDFVPKDHSEDLEYIVSRVGHIMANKDIAVLVVDDSPLARTIMVKLLNIQQFKVFETDNGIDAINILENNSDIRVVLTDYNMPQMNGLELTLKIREKYPREKLSIIAISSESDNKISSRLLKLGANDFIHKPFVKEEFDCRINNTVRALENLDKMFNLANRDYLTGLLNRRAFFKEVDSYTNEIIGSDEKFTLAMFDLDDFKQINDTYGHEAGDIVLQSFSKIVINHIRGADIAARFGGEEFCVILKNTKTNDGYRIFETIRSTIENKSVELSNGKKISFTVSIGVVENCDSQVGLNELIALADKRLYKAKLWGKNRICSDGE